MRMWFRVLAAVSILLLASPASADVTGFIGATTTPANRLVRGVAAGGGFFVISFEFGDAGTTDEPSSAAPAPRTGMGNRLLLPPGPTFAIEPEFTAGCRPYSA